MSLGVGEAARVGKAGEVFAVVVEVRDRVLRADENDDGVAAFLGLADADHLHAGSMRRQGVVIAQDIGVVSQLLGRADVMAEDFLGRRHGGADGKMVHQRADELRLGGPFLDAGRVVGVHGLSAGREGKCGNESEQ